MNWMNELETMLESIDNVVWGPCMLVALVGTGIFLTCVTGFDSWRSLGYALKSVLSKEARTAKGKGDISPFASLTTALAATIGTGNIVGVATAMASGGPGALVWMWLSAFFGLSTKFAESMLAVKYRQINSEGEMSGGPMYTMKNAFSHKGIGVFLGGAFALFTVVASFGIGNMTQVNSISEAISDTFGVTPLAVGIAIALLVFIVVVGGIKSIAKVSQVLVPAMSVFYVIAGVVVILCNYRQVPDGLATIFSMAFTGKSVAGGIAGTMTVSVMQSIKFGVARGVFSNEAGLGSAAITAAAATSDSPAKQGYINMTGTFFDTIVVCSITGLAIASSGMLGVIDNSTGLPYSGASLTIAAFESALGGAGGVLVSVGIALFAFSTILGWEYYGEKALEYLAGGTRWNIIYRILFPVVCCVGAVGSLTLVWSLSDIFNALMAIPNLISLWVLSPVVIREIREYQKGIG